MKKVRNVVRCGGVWHRGVSLWNQTAWVGIPAPLLLPMRLWSGPKISERLSASCVKQRLKRKNRCFAELWNRCEAVRRVSVGINGSASKTHLHIKIQSWTNVSLNTNKGITWSEASLRKLMWLFLRTKEISSQPARAEPGLNSCTAFPTQCALPSAVPRRVPEDLPQTVLSPEEHKQNFTTHDSFFGQTSSHHWMSRLSLSTSATEN